MTAAEDRTDGPDPSRRTLIRGVAAVGLAGAAGIPLVGCGSDGDGTQAGGAAPAAEPVVSDPTARPRPTGKSDVYKRTPEPRGTRSAVPEPTTEALSESVPTASPAASPAAGEGQRTPVAKGDDLATARQNGDKAAKGRPIKTAEPASPAPLPAGALARTSDIPVGGGKAFEAEKIVVTQPTKGTFKGFSAKCTHTGCFLDTVEGGVIVCPCHGSRFAIADGAVQKGPAMLPLPAEKISIDTNGVIIKG